MHNVQVHDDSFCTPLLSLNVYTYVYVHAFENSCILKYRRLKIQVLMSVCYMTLKNMNVDIHALQLKGLMKQCKSIPGLQRFLSKCRNMLRLVFCWAVLFWTIICDMRVFMKMHSFRMYQISRTFGRLWASQDETRTGMFERNCHCFS